MHDRESFVRLKWAARGIILATALFSVWANILHVTTVTLPAVIFAAAPPLIVLAGFEIISRIPSRHTKWYRRWVRPVAAAGISFGGAWLSYWHQKSAILRYNDGDEQNAAILPLLIDGLMIIASVSVIELNEWIRDIDLKLAGVNLAKAKPQEAPKEKVLTQKERIAATVVEMPWATAKEVAVKLQGDGYSVKEAYVSNVMSELRKVQSNGNGKVPAHN